MKPRRKFSGKPVRVAIFVLSLPALLAAQTISSPPLTYSTYLRSGFTPLAMAADSAGSLYLAGFARPDPHSADTSVVVVKLNPQASEYVYVTQVNGLDSASPSAIAVDNLGNAWITGRTVLPADPVHPDPSGPLLQPFLAKLDPTGTVLFAKTFGGPAHGFGAAILVSPKGEIFVSGTALSTGFRVTPGAYSVPDSLGRPYLVKFDAAGNVLLSAAGIGGSSIALDADGNIYVAGSTNRTDYPTTAGAYQTSFVETLLCTSTSPLGFCLVSTNQYVTKLDAKASTLLYSTGINGMDSGYTANAGLAVDASGNAYVTGTTLSPKYPFTTTPAPSPVAIPFVTKLDPAGKSLVWSVPQGGAGLQLDSARNSVYVTGPISRPWTLGFFPSSDPPPPPYGLIDLPAQCLTNNLTSITESFAAKLDAATGQTSAAQLISGSRVTLLGTALTGPGLFWFTGPASQADVPFTPDAMFPRGLLPGTSDGAYLGAVDFSKSAATGPSLSCVLDAADSAQVGLVAPNQLLALFGSNLGPPDGVTAPDGGSPSLAGVSVTFDGRPAQLLYVSASQVNVAVPFGVGSQASTVMRLSVNGQTSAPRLFPVTPSNPALFGQATFSTECRGIPTATGSSGSTVPIVRNEDGRQNSCETPAKPGSVISFFVNGVGQGSPLQSLNSPPPPGSLQFVAVAGPWSAEVVNVARENDFVWRVDIRLPAAASSSRTLPITLREGSLLVGPLQLFYQGGQAAQQPQLVANVWVGA